MARTNAGQPVKKVQITNALAVSLVNAKAGREQINASTAAALIIIEAQNSVGRGKNQGSFRDEITEK